MYDNHTHRYEEGRGGGDTWCICGAINIGKLSGLDGGTTWFIRKANSTTITQKMKQNLASFSLSITTYSHSIAAWPTHTQNVHSSQLTGYGSTSTIRFFHMALGPLMRLTGEDGCFLFQNFNSELINGSLMHPRRHRIIYVSRIFQQLTG